MLAEETFYKIILVGNAGVGKTHLLYRYVKGILPPPSSSTVGVGFATRSVPLYSGGSIKVQVWDSAGQEKFKSITWNQYRNAAAALLVYDVTNPSSFEAIQMWKQELDVYLDNDLVCMLVGNKTDLIERNPKYRGVPTARAASLARAHNFLFQETSAVSGSHVAEAFEELVQAVYNQRHQVQSLKGTRETVGYSLTKLPTRCAASNSCC